jgi:hypothetical protein
MVEPALVYVAGCFIGFLLIPKWIKHLLPLAIIFLGLGLRINGVLLLGLAGGLFARWFRQN